MLQIFNLGEWLQRKSISQRLGFQAGAAILLCLSLVSVIGVTSYYTFSVIEEDHKYAEQALASALLEKDFASLERDVFRYALFQDEATKAGFESNVGDLQEAIASTRVKLDESEHAEIEKVSESAATYVATVNRIVGAGRNDASGIAEIMEAGDTVDANIEAIRDPVIEKAAEVAESLEALVTTVMVLTIAIAFLVGASSFVIARAIRKTIARELDSIGGSIKQVLAGNLDAKIDYAERQDDVGELARAAVQLRETSREKRISDAEMAEMAERVGECLQRVSKGDLTVNLGEIGQRFTGLRQDFNSSIGQLHDTLCSVADAAHSIKAGSSEISEASDDLAQRTEHHASELAEIAEAINDISTLLSETADGAAQADRNGSDAMSEAKEGGAIIAQAVSAMEKIEASTDEIEQIIAVIDGLAFQTNLLALNAGVEAARAGSAGSGFAVVANEVRALAQRSADAAKDIKELIQTSTSQVAEGAEMVRKTGSAFERISEKVSSVTALVEKISAKAEQQASSLKETNNSMSKMDMVTQQNAAMVEESTAAARNLASAAENLAALVAKFDLNQGPRQIAPAASPAPRPAPRRVAAPKRAATPVTAGNLAIAMPDDDWSEF